MINYYAVIWGNVKRWTGEKVSSVEQAKIKCFGMSAPNMNVIPLGTRKAEAIKKLKTIPDPVNSIRFMK